MNINLTGNYTDKIIGFPCSFSVIKDAAVSSQLDSIPRIKGFCSYNLFLIIVQSQYKYEINLFMNKNNNRI